MGASAQRVRAAAESAFATRPDGGADVAFARTGENSAGDAAPPNGSDEAAALVDRAFFAD